MHSLAPGRMWLLARAGCSCFSSCSSPGSSRKTDSPHDLKQRFSSGTREANHNRAAGLYRIAVLGKQQRTVELNRDGEGGPRVRRPRGGCGRLDGRHARCGPGSESATRAGEPAGGPDPKLREMASAVLRGELTAQQAFTDPEYTSALFAGAAEVRRAGEQRSSSEVDEAGARFAAWQRQRDGEDEDERAESARRNSGSRLMPKHRADPGT